MKLTKYKLGDVAKVEISGVDKKTKDGEIPVKLCNFTDVYYNWSITKDMEDSFMVASANANEIHRFSLKKGQVAFTKDSETRDDIGIPAYIAEDFDNVILGYHCALITPDESKVLGAYINVFMHTSLIQKYFANNASGSGQRYSLSVETMERMPLFLPSLEEQKRIADLFTNLNRKIALNRQINTNLEALARQLYDYWFVQFDFPDANGKPYKSSGGKMTYNEKLKRHIPEGWEVKKLKDCIEHINTGLNPRDNFVFGGDIRYITVKNLTTDGVVDFSNCDYINEEARIKVHRRSQIEVGDILYASICPLGRTYLITSYPKDWDINESVFSIRPNKKIISSEYLDLMLKDDYYIRKLTQSSTGSIFQGIRIHELETTYILVPKIEVINDFSKSVFPLISHKSKMVAEISSLTRQRDELLPLLMNGQVSVE